MNKKEFLSGLRERLAGLPEEDVRRSEEFYAEMIDDRVEDGLAEEEAVAAVGTPEEAAEQILMDMPLKKVINARMKPKRSLRAWEIVLLVLGAPLWLPLLLTALALLLTFFAVLWAIVAVFYAVDLAVLLSGLAAAAAGIIEMIRGGVPLGLAVLGAGLACMGLALLLLPLCNLIAALMARLSAATARGIKSMFVRRNR